MPDSVDIFVGWPSGDLFHLLQHYVTVIQAEKDMQMANMARFSDRFLLTV